MDKLIQLWRLRKSIYEAKSEISVSGALANKTTKQGGHYELNYKSSYLHQLFKKRNLEITAEERRLAALHMYEN